MDEPTLTLDAESLLSSPRSNGKERRPMPDILSPDCRDGKCAACTGDAWNNQTDEPTPCECACHETKEE